MLLKLVVNYKALLYYSKTIRAKLKVPLIDEHVKAFNECRRPSGISRL